MGRDVEVPHPGLIGQGQGDGRFSGRAAGGAFRSPWRTTVDSRPGFTLEDVVYRRFSRIMRAALAHRPQAQCPRPGAENGVAGRQRPQRAGSTLGLDPRYFDRGRRIVDS